MIEPPESWQWMTPEIRDLLNRIPPPHEAKRRRTVILLAFAHATQTPVKDVFGRDDTCAEQIWWTKWQYVPEISAALAACKARALEWADVETVTTEDHFRRLRRRALAEHAAAAPAALKEVMTDAGQKGVDRISAAETLMRWAEPETGSKLGRPGGSASFEQRVDVYDLGSLSDDELAALDRLAERGRGAAAGVGATQAA
jgi:hypothetical protein